MLRLRAVGIFGLQAGENVNSGICLIYFLLYGKSETAADVVCYGWHCVAVKY